MSAKAIREYDGKRLLSTWQTTNSAEPAKQEPFQGVLITPVIFDSTVPDVSWESVERDHPWIVSTALVVKPDQLIKRRGKSNLLLLNASWMEVKDWIIGQMGKEVQIGPVSGVLDHFLVEPFVPHAPEDEYYICVQSNRCGEEFLFHHEGGIDVGDIDAKAFRLTIPLDVEDVGVDEIQSHLLSHVPSSRQPTLTNFLLQLLRCYRELHFTYLEINPLVVTSDQHQCLALDMAAKLDETASFLVGQKWGNHLEFPPAFGRAKFPEEAYVHELDSKTGASLKLTILNHAGRIWTMVAGGGASVVYADTISDLGFGHELANYGEYSGAPSEEHTYEYAKTILDLMTRGGRVEEGPGKVLIIGGGIANFTDVALTFKGIIRAIGDFQEKLRRQHVSIWVRRGGPNYQEGLRSMKITGLKTGVPIHVYGPETHITAIVPLALDVPGTLAMEEWSDEASSTSPSRRSSASRLQTFQSSASSSSMNNDGILKEEDQEIQQDVVLDTTTTPVVDHQPVNDFFQVHKDTVCIVYGLQKRAVQGMLDFDVLCKRTQPSVAAMIFPFSGNHYVKFYWGTTERLIPVYQNIAEACRKHPLVTVLVNFSSFRSVVSSTMEALECSTQIQTHAIIAEGVPERETRKIIRAAKAKGVHLIGPATVGGIKPGCFRIGNTGGMLDNIVQSKLYRPGSVAYVSKSGGMSNELNNIISQCTDGVYEGVAIGGDRYPGSRFIDHLLRYESNDEIKLLVLLGEVGGHDEFDVCSALLDGRLTKPLVAWCIGTCAKIFPYEVQFGHAGACAEGQSETADAKNQALRAAGALVPTSFDGFRQTLSRAYDDLVAQRSIVPRVEVPVPVVPMDYAWAKNLGLIRKPANFISSISDDRGEELKYAGMPISEVFAEDIGIGGVVGLLWFKRKLPGYASKFIEMVLMVTADHGPAVSGAHNTIVTARAGKDLISSLVSGLLTIGPRFGGALDAAAKVFSEAKDAGLTPSEFVQKMRQDNQLIMGYVVVVAVCLVLTETTS